MAILTNTHPLPPNPHVYHLPLIMTLISQRSGIASAHNEINTREKSPHKRPGHHITLYWKNVNGNPSVVLPGVIPQWTQQVCDSSILVQYSQHIPLISQEPQGQDLVSHVLPHPPQLGRLPSFHTLPFSKTMKSIKLLHFVLCNSSELGAKMMTKNIFV